MKTNSIFFKELNKGWFPAVVDNIYIDGKFEKNVFCHAKLVHRIENDDHYYEVMTPTANFQISYVVADKIRILDAD